MRSATTTAVAAGDNLRCSTAALMVQTMRLAARVTTSLTLSIITGQAARLELMRRCAVGNMSHRSGCAIVPVAWSVHLLFVVH
jgi:hypothetical protein